MPSDPTCKWTTGSRNATHADLLAAGYIPQPPEPGETAKGSPIRVARDDAERSAHQLADLIGDPETNLATVLCYIEQAEASLKRAEEERDHYRILARELATDASALRAPPNPSQPQEPAKPDWCECEEFGQFVPIPCPPGKCPTVAQRLKEEAQEPAEPSDEALDTMTGTPHGSESPALAGGHGPVEALRAEIVANYRWAAEAAKNPWWNTLADRLERKP